MKQWQIRQWLWMGIWGLLAPCAIQAGDVLAPASERFAAAEVTEVPSFQRHVLPLMGRLGCNGRSCHGSFQGQGGFRLSLFGYDFKADHEALLSGDNPRIDKADPEESLMLLKGTLEVPHKGGKRMVLDGWQHRLFLKWIQGGAEGTDVHGVPFERLEVTPTRIQFQKPGETVQLKVTAVWGDGTHEDVTPLCRFRTNDESISEINEDGLVTSLGKGDTHVVAFYDNGVVPVQTLLPITDKIGPNYPSVPTPTKIDELIVQKLRTLGVVPSDLANDAEFLRRVSLDMTGSLPTSTEVETFLADASPDKRAKKIDELLERPTYSAWWATRMCDILGNNPSNFTEQGMGPRASQQWYDWIERRIRENQPYDKIVEGMLLAVSRKPGQSYDEYVAEQSTLFRKDDPVDYSGNEFMPHFWARRTFSDPAERSMTVAYAFLGVRMQCAQCHKHPFDQWTQDDFNEFANFFGRVSYNVAPDARDRYKELQATLPKGNNKARYEMIYEGKPYPYREVVVAPLANPPKNKGKEGSKKPRITDARSAKVLGGEEVAFEKGLDPRTPLIDWFRSADNPYFAKAYVNRVWAAYFGVGIIEPADDLNLANPPSNAELLDYLAAGFVAHKYDMKWLHREITNSRAYQLSWQTNATNEFDGRNFSHALPRRMPAEVAFDAVRSALATDDQITAGLQDPRKRAIAMTTDYPRGDRNPGNYALAVFGRPVRRTNCDCERQNEPSLLQTMYLRNDGEMLNNIQNSTWVRAIERQLGIQTSEAKREQARATADKAKRRDLRQTLEKLEQRLADAVKAEKDEQVKKLEQQVADLKRKMKDLRADKPEPEVVVAETTTTGSGPMSDEQLNQVVRQAFLRTVSRPPSEEELQKSRAYLTESEQVTVGLRDLLWALLNTKEFIVNH